MTTPSILPTVASGTYKDYLHTKVDRGGQARVQAVQVSVPSGTTTTTIVGLAPFNKGFRMNVGGTQLASAALGSSVTLDIGYVYDLNGTYTNDSDAFATGLTAAAAGGLLVFDETTGLGAFCAEGDGWIVAVVQGATTGTTGNIFGQIEGVYDGLSAASN